MSSLAFDFGSSERTAYYDRQLRRAVDDASQAMGPAQAATACGLKTSGQLREMIDGTNGRRMSTDIAAVIADRIGPGSYRDAIIDAIKGLFGMHQPEADGPYIRRLEDGYSDFGPQGTGELAEIRKAARRG